MAKEEYSAIPSWSGYIYQGKIAIYHVLSIIKNNLNTDTNMTFDNYELEIEWQEDFAIKNGKYYESIHQVKAYQCDTNCTDYKNALVGLVRKVQKQYTKGYLHILTPIIYNSSITDFKTYQKKNFYIKFYPKKYSKKISVYRYSTGNEIRGLDEIDTLIIEKIEQVYSLNSFNIKSLTIKQYSYIIFKLYQLLDVHILKIHMKIKDKNQTIPFNEILDIFKTNYEEYSREYEYIKVKNNFLKNVNEYCKNSRNCSVDLEFCNDNCTLFKIEKELESKTAEEVYNIILQSTPHYKSMNDLLDDAGLIFGLIRIFHKLNKTYQTYQYLYRKENIYLPTTIHTPENIPIIAKNILDNKELDSIIPQYEVDIFISKDVNSMDILKDARDCKDVGDKDIDYLFGKERRSAINKINQIQIKSLDDVKGELI